MIEVVVKKPEVIVLKITKEPHCLILRKKSLVVSLQVTHVPR